MVFIVKKSFVRHPQCPESFVFGLQQRFQIRGGWLEHVAPMSAVGKIFFQRHFNFSCKLTVRRFCQHHSRHGSLIYPA